MKTEASLRLRRMVVVGVFAALSYVVMLMIHFPVMFLTLDVKDAVMCLCGLYFGPVAGAVLAVLVPLLEFATVSSTGLYGLIMNILGSVAFVLPAAVIYRYRKTFNGAMLGILSSVFAMIAVMLVANLIVTPYFMGATVDTVVAMIPRILLPFNAVKAVLNAAIVLLLYKPLSRILRRTGFLVSRKHASEGAIATDVAASPSDALKTAENAVFSSRSTFPWRSAAVTAIAVVLIAASLVVIFVVLKGEFTFGIRRG